MRNLKFYKYRGCDDLDRDLKIISDCKIWYSNPTQFNDPFDCAPTNVTFSIDEKREFACGILKSDNPDIPEEWRITLRDAIDDDQKLCQMVDRVLTPEYLDRLMSQYGILSLSSTYDNPLLWAHYSSSHHGFAIEFDVTKTVHDHVAGLDKYPLDYFESRLMAKPVEYSANRPPSISPEHHLATPFFHKGSEWAYEQEYRVLSNFSAGLKDFHCDLISGVYLGCKASCETKQKVLNVVREFAKKTGNSIKKYQARPDNQTYDLHFDEIE